MKRFMIAAVFLAAVVDAVDPPGVINAAVQAAATQVAAGATGTSVCAQATAACATATSCVDNTTLLAKQVLCTQAANLFYECPACYNHHDVSLAPCGTGFDTADSELACAHCAGGKALVRSCECSLEMQSLEAGSPCSTTNLCVPGCTALFQGENQYTQFMSFIAAREKPVNGAYPTGKTNYINAVETIWDTYQDNRAASAAAAISNNEERMRLKETQSSGQLLQTLGEAAKGSTQTYMNWPTALKHRDVFLGSGSILGAATCPLAYGTADISCTANTATATSTASPNALRLPTAGTPGLARVQDFLRRLQAKLRTAFAAEVTEKCSPHHYDNINRNVVVSAMDNQQEDGWDGVGTTTEGVGDLGMLANLKIGQSSGFISVADGGTGSYDQATGSLVKHLKFNLGCCYASSAAIKITEITPGQSGGSEFVSGFSVVKQGLTTSDGLPSAWVTADRCGIVDGTTTTMKQTQIEQIFAKAVAEFRFCIANEILTGTACSPAIIAPTAAPTAAPVGKPAAASGKRL